MKINVLKPTGQSNPGSAAPKNETIIFEFLDGFVFPPSDAGGVEIQGSFVLPAGDKMVKLYSTKSKTEFSMESEGEEDAMSFKSMAKLQHPGDSKEIREFVQYWTGRNCGVATKACGEDFYNVYGTPCSPLQLKATKTDNNDARNWGLAFEPFAKSAMVPKIYRGAITYANPFAVSSVDTVPLLIANGLQYKLPALAITDVIEVDGIDMEHGTVVTLIGSGGVAPATLANAVSGDVTVILAGGTTWTALDRAVIHLKVFLAGATKYLVELSRE